MMLMPLPLLHHCIAILAAFSVFCWAEPNPNPSPYYNSGYSSGYYPASSAYYPSPYNYYQSSGYYYPQQQPQYYRGQPLYGQQYGQQYGGSQYGYNRPYYGTYPYSPYSANSYYGYGTNSPAFGGSQYRYSPFGSSSYQQQSGNYPFYPQNGLYAGSGSGGVGNLQYDPYYSSSSSLDRNKNVH